MKFFYSTLLFCVFFCTKLFAQSPIITYPTSPQFIQYGQVLIIQGSNFVPGATTATVGGVPVNISVSNSTQIILFVQFFFSGSLAVTTSGGTVIGPYIYVMLPQFTSFSPASAGPGDTVTISGSGFSPGEFQSISFGGVAAVSFIVSSPGSIKAVVGNGASGNITAAFLGQPGFSPFLSLPNFVFKPDTDKVTLCSPVSGSMLVSPFTGTYQWQVNSGSGFSNISTSNRNYSGVNKDTLQLVNIPSYWYGYTYCCMVNGVVREPYYTLQFKDSWTGAADTLWTNPLNWSCNTVPDGNTDVLIDSGYAVLDSIGASRSITLNPTAQLTVTSSSSLAVNKKTVATLAYLATGPVNAVASGSAIVIMNIISNGGSTVSAHGVCYSTSPNPTLSNNVIASHDTSSVNVAYTITGLLPNTTYYVKSFATNGTGTAYGNQLSFTTSLGLPVISTMTASAITTVTAVVGGNITNNGGASITASGICYSIEPNPVLADSSIANTGTDSFFVNVSGLLPGGTYYVRAYATNSVGTAYGNQIVFTTLPIPPTVTTDTLSDIGADSAIGGGVIVSDGGAVDTLTGLCYSISPNPTTADSLAIGNKDTGSFTGNLIHLNPNTVYYVRAYATNVGGTGYGNQVSFTTAIGLPVISTSTADSITATTAVIGGDITGFGGGVISASGICYSVASNPTLSDSSIANTGSDSFYIHMSGLTPGMTYYARAYATNSAGTSYGNQIIFAALPLPPTVTTAVLSDIRADAAIGGGAIVSNGGGAVSITGLCYSISPNPTIIKDSLATGNKDTGNFTGNLIHLIPQTVYYVRAYATNAGGTGYGNQVSFTSGVANAVVYVGSSDDSLYVLDARTGSQRWKYAAGAGISSCPAIAGSNIYFVSDNLHAYALDTTAGHPQWSTVLAGSSAEAGFMSPDISNGYVYVGGSTYLNAVNDTTGSLLWNSYSSGNWSAPVVSGGTVYASHFANGAGYAAYDAITGQGKWSYDDGLDYGNPAVAGKEIYSGGEGILISAVDTGTGSRRWYYATGGEGSPSSPTIGNGMVFDIDYGGTLYAVDSAAGTLKWSYPLGGTNYPLSNLSPIISNGSVYASVGGNLYAIDANTGSLEWSLSNNFAVNFTVANGLVYIGGGANTFYALDAGTGGQIWSSSINGSASGPCVTDSKKAAYYSGNSGEQN